MRMHLPVRCCLLLALFSVRPATAIYAQSVPVGGAVIQASTGSPAPGLTASLVHRVFGRSAPSFTDALGRFGWSAIPVSPEPYFLEIYWGNNLIYRQPVSVQGPVWLPPIGL